MDFIRLDEFLFVDDSTDSSFISCCSTLAAVTCRSVRGEVRCIARGLILLSAFKGRKKKKTGWTRLAWGAWQLSGTATLCVDAGLGYVPQPLLLRPI